MKASLVLPATTGFFLLVVLAHLGFFDLERLARGVRNLGILGSEMLPPDVGILPTVGAGGLGFVIQIYLQSLDYQRLATILLLVLVIVLIMDGLSGWLRKRYLLAAQVS